MGKQKLGYPLQYDNYNINQIDLDEYLQNLKSTSPIFRTSDFHKNIEHNFL